MKKNRRLFRLTKIALATAFMCVIAPISLPLGAIPFTLGSLCLYLIALSFSPMDTFLTVFLYIAVGLLGLPVFSGFTGGVQALVSPTGGFLLAYPFTALLISYIGGGFRGHFARRSIALLLGTVFLYVCGVIGYLFVTGAQFDLALSVLFLPLFLADLLKVAAALFVFTRLSPFLERKG